MTHIAAYRGGLYDGNAGFQTRFNYGIGLASSIDGETWTKLGQIFTAAGSGWETAHLTDPCLVKLASGTLRCYFAAAQPGFDSDPERGSVLFTIGAGDSTDNGDTWGPAVQVLDVGGSGDPDEGNVRHPYVIEDLDEPDPDRRFKMWCSGQDGSYNYPTILYAYSADGLTFTKAGVVLSPGTESTYGCISPVVVFSGGTGYLYYAGITYPDSFLGGSGPLQSQLCLATFTDPESTYTKSGSNPLVTVPSPYPDDYRDVTATVAASATSLTVADASGYATDDEFYVMQYGYADTPAYFAAKVTSVSGTTINFTPPAPATHTVDHANGHYVLTRKICLGSLEPRSVVQIGSEWVLYCSVIGAIGAQYDTGAPIEPAPPFARAVAVTSTSLGSGWGIDHTRSLLLPLGTDSGPFGEHTYSGWDADEAAQLAYPTSTAGVAVAFDPDYRTPFTDIQHVCANATNVVVIADHYDGALDHVSIDVAVFDLTGTLLVWEHATTATLGQFTGSCLDDTAVYFMYTDTDDTFAKVDLAAGTWTDLFTVPDVDAQVPSATFGTGIGRGIVEKDGDLIIAGTYGLARVQQDGTLVWWADISDPTYEYRGLARSGNGSVWVSQTTNTADEWAYDGTYRQSADIVEFAPHLWLLKTPGGWSVDVLYF